MTLPVFYVENVVVMDADTLMVRGNRVSDISGMGAIGIQVTAVTNLRAKDNQAVRIRSPFADAKGFEISNVTDAVLVYNVASRTNTGFDFSSIRSLDVYNLTAHLCDRCVVCEDGTFRNIAFSAYQEYDLYGKSYGFYAPTGDIDIDYVYYWGLADLVESSVSTTSGSEVLEKHILYLDEPNDDLTPDYISPTVNSGTPNPLLVDTSDIGGVESSVTTETTAKINYWYELLDNSFWDISNQYSVEASFIKALQSRVLASAEVATTQAKNDMYIKTAVSVERFSELFPMYARYANSSAFKKRVMDVWYAAQNVGTIQAYQNAIGGYNLFPSFFKRMEDYEDGWIIDVSYVAYDNWLNSISDLRYGIGIDVLGTSTMNQATSGECYNNMANCVEDIAPIRWFLHNEVEPYGYLMFTDSYNSFEDCECINMHYNDDFNISTTVVDVSGQITTPLIPTASLVTTGTGPSAIEVSMLDRIWSEDIARNMYYRQGASVGTMSAWTELDNAVGEVILVDQDYLQFLITVDGVVREIDYEFMGICLRWYTSQRDWTRPTSP